MVNYCVPPGCEVGGVYFLSLGRNVYAAGLLYDDGKIKMESSYWTKDDCANTNYRFRGMG